MGRRPNAQLLLTLTPTYTRSSNGAQYVLETANPGSTLLVVWQRRQADRRNMGDFDLARDVEAVFGAPSDDVLIVKVNIWLSW